jgi:hypothetical protein
MRIEAKTEGGSCEIERVLALIASVTSLCGPYVRVCDIHAYIHTNIHTHIHIIHIHIYMHACIL